ncbi:2-oxoglutarate dehydrogenase E1 component [Marinihelvus fidelis]|uniref:2-oxoglutarate dehydrogenase E1 component n=1 Tax=Marinihelvus fidelis TaxID=2613842 RepID=A0A5N0TE91_9GAMM|nr:2-oxoglutarate dehydrogenase E1 component [Marinihelvus fidelis]KAA9133300.1 2-oxoglutarate dehydrogenase E1 component [Marinihelvus fidelis]
MSSTLKALYASSQFNGGNAAWIEAMYEDWLEDPSSVPAQWREVFQGLGGDGSERGHLDIQEHFRLLGRMGGQAVPVASESQDHKQAGVMRLINAHRVRGHEIAKIDPLGRPHHPPVPDLDLSFHDLNDADLDREFNTGWLAAPNRMKLRDIEALLKKVYTRSIGAEFMHIVDTRKRRWLEERLEGCGGDFGTSNEEKVRLLEMLTAAEGLEKFLHTKYVGQKRFSLEGGESLIPLLHETMLHSGANGVEEIVIGMAHRGRLNVLVNILGKSPADLFDEFEGKHDDHPGRSGDVKYHLGFASDIQTPGGPVHMALAFNPSHLEIVDPVVVGSARARQVRRDDESHDQVMPILIHGDAAFAGQGVIMELFQMSETRGFAVGGTMHIVVNNQVGFTTSNPRDARSTLYCTAIAKMVHAPIFHVNADDPEAVHHVMKIACDFRTRFKRDVVIDLVCYRRHGHNEADEPSATQPVMYDIIRGLKTTRAKYAEKLEGEGTIEKGQAQAMMDAYREKLDRGEQVADVDSQPRTNEHAANWHDYDSSEPPPPPDTGVPVKRARELANALLDIPADFKLHPRVQRIVDDRRKMAAGELPMDWGFAETLAYATLIDQDKKLRLVGQDSGRGTFFHRHAVLHNQADGSTLLPLAQLRPESDVTVIDSLLSEEAVMAFEYGYATAAPETLVIWEAQFGDFANGAQVVIDQFLASGEAKWGRLCGLTLFLPHGYEGQGPEHSSARLERFLQLCSFGNMQVCVPSTPAQIFHMLRRQMMQATRKPLVVMMPKSLLRNKASTSPLDRVEKGGFQLVIDDRQVTDKSAIDRLVLCSGKVYYDLDAKRTETEAGNIALVRIEQLHPFPETDLKALLATYPNLKEVVWCQEEPKNQGAWYQIRHHLQVSLGEGHDLFYVGRRRSPSPATGYFKVHLAEQEKLVTKALTLGKGHQF